MSVHGVGSRPRDVAEAIERFVDDQSFPVEWYGVGPTEDGILLEVAVDDVAAARGHLVARPFVLADGRVEPVIVTGVRAASWGSMPIHPCTSAPDPVSPEELLGLEVSVAAARANAAGWVVRAHEPQAVLTADLRTDRMNLRYGADGVVTDVHLG